MDVEFILQKAHEGAQQSARSDPDQKSQGLRRKGGQILAVAHQHQCQEA